MPDQRTDAELAKMRDDVIQHLNRIHHYEDINFTCDECDQRHVCPFVYDPYNTDGDCLAEK
jgi:hypothetical protein